MSGAYLVPENRQNRLTDKTTAAAAAAAAAVVAAQLSVCFVLGAFAYY